MSMIGNFVGASDEQIDALHRDPQTITGFLYGDAAAGLATHDEGRHLDIDKAWHAIHFLLAGKPWSGELPLGFIVSGGQPIGDVDVGYGPARSFTSAQVQEISAALSTISRADLMARWDADAFDEADIYGVDPDEAEREDAYVGENYESLVAFIRQLADDGLGMIVYVN